MALDKSNVRSTYPKDNLETNFFQALRPANSMQTKKLIAPIYWNPALLTSSPTWLLGKLNTKDYSSEVKTYIVFKEVYVVKFNITTTLQLCALFNLNGLLTGW